MKLGIGIRHLISMIFRISIVCNITLYTPVFTTLYIHKIPYSFTTPITQMV